MHSGVSHYIYIHTHTYYIYSKIELLVLFLQKGWLSRCLRGNTECNIAVFWKGNMPCVSGHKKKKTFFVSPHAVETAKTVIHDVTQCTVCALKYKNSEEFPHTLVSVKISFKLLRYKDCILCINDICFICKNRSKIPITVKERRK